jgi:hypothetical protein
VNGTLAPANVSVAEAEVPLFQEPFELLLTDACDRCGYSEDCRADGQRFYNPISQAFVAVRLKPGKMLKFCGHHYAKHADALMEQGAEMLDMRSKINGKNESSAVSTI